MVNPESDFEDIQQPQSDLTLSTLVDAVMQTDHNTKDRKTVLTVDQALHVALARSYADSFIVLGIDDDGNEFQVEGPLEEVHLLCDYLENTAVSVQGKGLKQLVEILTSQNRQSSDESDLDKTAARVMK